MIKKRSTARRYIGISFILSFSLVILISTALNFNPQQSQSTEIFGFNFDFLAKEIRNQIEKYFSINNQNNNQNWKFDIIFGIIQWFHIILLQYIEKKKFQFSSRQNQFIQHQEEENKEEENEEEQNVDENNSEQKLGGGFWQGIAIICTTGWGIRLSTEQTIPGMINLALSLLLYNHIPDPDDDDEDDENDENQNQNHQNQQNHHHVD